MPEMQNTRHGAGGLSSFKPNLGANPQDDSRRTVASLAGWDQSDRPSQKAAYLALISIISSACVLAVLVACCGGFAMLGTSLHQDNARCVFCGREWYLANRGGAYWLLEGSTSCPQCGYRGPPCDFYGWYDERHKSKRAAVAPASPADEDITADFFRDMTNQKPGGKTPARP